MNQARTAAANAVYEAFDFGATVEDQSGWEYTTPGNRWARSVFVKQVDDNYDVPTTKLTFVVCFKDQGTDVEQSYAIDDKGNLWGESDDGRRIGIRVVVDALYLGDAKDLEWLKASVESEAQRSIAAGLLSHGTATPDEYTMTVAGTNQEEVDLDEEEIANWIAGTIESGNMKLEDIPKLMARYALADPSAMRSEFAERMGL